MEGYSRDKLLCGIRENEKSLNGIRDLTATREAGLTGCGIGKQNALHEKLDLLTFTHEQI